MIEILGNPTAGGRLSPQSIKEIAERIAATNCTRFCVDRGAREIAAALRLAYATGYGAGLRDGRVAVSLGDTVEAIDWAGVAKLAEERICRPHCLQPEIEG